MKDKPPLFILGAKVMFFTDKKNPEPFKLLYDMHSPPRFFLDFCRSVRQIRPIFSCHSSRNPPDSRHALNSNSYVSTQKIGGGGLFRKKNNGKTFAY